MININKISLKLLMLLGILFALSACNKDILPEGKILENNELKTVLEAMGFEFDVDNRLVMNDKSLNAKALDLSGKQLTNYKGLDIFPALEEVNLANNKFEEFDFDLLPQNITKIDLQGNKLYEFKNLKKERKFAKLYLPETAKYNMAEVLDYYTANKDQADIRIKMDGRLEKYSYLRVIPDPVLRTYLKEKFPSVFTGDKIDLSKEMALQNASQGLNIGESELDPYDKDIYSLEGIQYITGFKNFNGNIIVAMKSSLNTRIGYFKVPKETALLGFVNVNFMETVDWTGAKKLETCAVINGNGLKKVDLSFSEKFGAAPLNFSEGINLKNCPELEEVILPNRKNQEINFFIFKKLPKVKEIDLSKIEVLAPFSRNQIEGLPSSCKLIYPVKLTPDRVGPRDNKINLCVDQAVSERLETKAFVAKFEAILNYGIDCFDPYGKALKSTEVRLRSTYGNTSITGDYSGILEPVINEKRYNNVNSTFTLTQRAANTMDIYLPPFKIGSMPGYLNMYIHDTGFTTATNGNISFTGSQQCVHIRLPVIGLRSFQGDYNGTIKGNRFYFFIHSEGWIKILFFWKYIKADVTFNGTKN